MSSRFERCANGLDGEAELTEARTPRIRQTDQPVHSTIRRVAIDLAIALSVCSALAALATTARADGHRVLEEAYDKSQGLAGFRDKRTKEIVIPAQFDAITGFSEGLAAVAVPRKRGYFFIDETGKVAIPGAFQDCNAKPGLCRFKNGRAHVCDDRNVCFDIDRSGNHLGDSSGVASAPVPTFNSSKKASPARQPRSPAASGATNGPGALSGAEGASGASADGQSASCQSQVLCMNRCSSRYDACIHPAGAREGECASTYDSCQNGCGRKDCHVTSGSAR